MSDMEDMDEDGDGWAVTELKCRICGHQTVSAHPAEMPEPDNLECPVCANMTMEPAEAETWQF